MRAVLWLLGLVALAAGLVLVGIVLWPLVASIFAGDAGSTEAGLDDVLGPQGIVAVVLLAVGAVLLAAGERSGVKVEVSTRAAPETPAVRVRCAACGGLNEESAAFCAACGQAMQ